MIVSARYYDFTQDPSYQKFVLEMSEKCTCTPESDRPCAGLLAGGFCDDLHMGREITDEDEDNDCEPDDL